MSRNQFFRKIFTVAVCLSVFMGIVTTSLADTKKAVKKSSRALEGTVQTRIGELKFENGYPSNATIDKLYNEMDFQRAVQAYLWGLPMVEMAEWQKAQKDIFKAGTNDFVTYNTFTQKLGILTANATTPYMMAFPNLKETGPMVFEIPAGPTAGGLLDFWERSFSDLGQTGPDKGQGAKYLILGPGHEDMTAEGYIIVRSPTWNIFLGHRVLHPDPETARQLTLKHKIYPYAERNNPTPTRHIASEGKDWEAYQSRGVTYFERLASILEVEQIDSPLQSHRLFYSLGIIIVDISTQFSPSKHLLGPQSHILTIFSPSGAQPQAPIEHRFGKSSTPPQQSAVVTTPPDLMQAHSKSEMLHSSPAIELKIKTASAIPI